MKTTIQVLVLMISVCVSAHAGEIDPALRSFQRGESGKVARVIALFDTQHTSLPPPARYHTSEVIRFFKAVTREAWSNTERDLSSDAASKKEIRLRGLYWINASASFDVTPRGLEILSKKASITRIYANQRIFYDHPVSSGFTRPLKTMPYDFAETGMDRLLAEKPDINGRGVVIGHVDTGVDGKHPALQGKIISFYNANTGKPSEPFDADQHGTHTAGTMVGGNRTDMMFGMAPEAKLVSTAALSGYEDMLKGMQFMLSPGAGIPLPRAVSNSWNCGGATGAQRELFYKAISGWEAAGVLPVFSAGNAGPNPRSITPPHEHPLAFAIGATDQKGMKASFSSVGPGVFQGQETKKPDVTAPGVDIVSSLPGGKMGKMSGTSMSAPHMGGATALVFQVNPALTPEQTRALFIRTAQPRDAQGKPGPAGVWNAYYGYGKMDVYAAVKTAVAHAFRKGGQSGGQAMLGSFSFFQTEEERIAEELERFEPANLDDWILGSK